MSEIFNSLKRHMSRKKNSFMPCKIPTVKFDKFIPQTHLGRTPKEWVMCEGWFLRPMYEELRENPDSNFVTCMDALIYDDEFDFDGLDRTKVSGILKKADSGTDYDISGEIIACRIANLFNVKSQYVAAIGNSQEKCFCVDFLSGKQTMDNYYEFTSAPLFSAFSFDEGDSPIRPWVEHLEVALESKLAHLPITEKQKIIDDVLTGFIQQYIFKKYIVRDTDPAGVNYSLVHEKDDLSDLQMSPLYDLQHAFQYFEYPQTYGLKEDLEFLASKYPNCLDRVVAGFGEPNFLKIKSIIWSYSPYAYQREKRLSIVKNGYRELINNYHMIKKAQTTSEMEQKITD
jgi:hypothetical protein